ncbi:adenylate/guanylate cyclase domain-containing protein [Ruegeria lacuscaerulensis]|uniref:adenylate/guanylate cyclase domain-containing protein n=1 Tax=Ruegeria lacuscaerulensis TaxID=55218 RepID=UPI00147BB162|nr:adenylate/guanylate cyclase domain-containing protein [Ruegeria lacuscaerulensis]
MAVRHREIKANGRGTVTQQARLWSGLVLLAYATGHFINHGLGLVSLEWMDRMLAVMSAIWSSVPGTVLLYGALAVHVLLGAVTILSIRSLKMPFWRWFQIILGLAIPYWLVSHIIVTRGSELLTGVPVSYLQELSLLWPVAAIKQNALMLLVWGHGLIGVHFWLRPKHWYKDGLLVLLPLAVAVPIVAMAGWMTAAKREVLRLSLDPDGAEATELALRLTEVRAAVSEYQAIAQGWVVIILCALLSLFVLFLLGQNLRRKVRVTYGEGLTVDAAPGKTILDVSRDNGIDHLSVCGGRARCSTCRVVVLSEQDGLSPIGPAERKLLDKINAEPNMRLACQARVNGDVSLRPIIQPQRAASTPLKSDPFGWGVEREVSVLNLKIKDFRPFVDKSLPYDVIFVLNQLLDMVVEQIEEQNGHIDKFTNDGLTAVFGLETHKTQAARSALYAAAKCQLLVQETQGSLSQHLVEPLKIGIGVHSGRAIIGRVGKTSDQAAPSPVTAIGNVSIIAEAFETVTNKIEAGIVYSTYMHEMCGLGIPDMLGKTGGITIQGVSEPVQAVIVKNSGPLKKKLELT